MAEIYYVPETESLATNFSPWMAIANNSISFGKNILNLVAMSIQELKEKMFLVDKQWRITDADISEIDHTWAINSKVLSVEIDKTIDDDTFISSAYIASGYIPKYEYVLGSGYISSGYVGISIDNITTEEDFYKALPTSFVTKEVFSGNSDHSYGKCEYNNGILRIKHEDFYTEQIIQFNKTIDPTNTDVLTDLVSIDYDPEYIANTEFETSYVNRNTNIQLPNNYIYGTVKVFKLIDQYTQYPIESSGFILPTSIESIPSGIVTIPDGYVCVGYNDQSEYVSVYKPRNIDTGVYKSEYDFDGDGFINNVEIDLMTSVLNTSASEMTEEEWEDQYQKYDLNNDFVINSDDLEILKKYINSFRDNTSDAIQIKVPGNYLLIYDTAGQPGVTGYLSSSNQIRLWRNSSFGGSLQTPFPDTYVDIDYDYDQDMFLMLDDGEKCIWSILFDENQSIVDKYKILLPIESVDEKMVGITYSGKGYVYALSFNRFGNGYLYRCNLRSKDVDTSASKIPVYIGFDNVDDFLYTENGGFSIGQSGLTSFCGNNRLFITANNKVYILEPRYDVMINDGNTVHCRSKYNHVLLSNGALSRQAKQFWHHVWNEFDEFGWKVGLERLPGENNLELKLRVLDVYKHYPHPSEQGYIYGILRDLGEQHFNTKKNNSYILDHFVHIDETHTTSVKIGFKLPIELKYDAMISIPVYNSNGVLLYNKYEMHGFNPFTGEDNVLLYTVDGSTIVLNFDIINTYEDLIVIDYFYIEDNLITAGGKQFIVSSFTPPSDPFLEIFRIADYDRLAKPQYGFYNNGRPTSKLLNIVKELKRIDNTTFNNFIANESRFDMGSKYFFGDTSIPQYWQE